MSGYWRRSLFIGGAFGLAVTHLSLVGLVAALNDRELVAGLVSVGSIISVIFALAAGYLAGGPRRKGLPALRPLIAIASGAVAGLVVGIMVAALAWLIDAFNPRDVLINASPKLVLVLHWGQDVTVGNVINVVGGALMGALGAGCASCRRTSAVGPSPAWPAYWGWR